MAIVVYYENLKHYPGKTRLRGFLEVSQTKQQLQGSPASQALPGHAYGQSSTKSMAISPL